MRLWLLAGCALLCAVVMGAVGLGLAAAHAADDAAVEVVVEPQPDAEPRTEPKREVKSLLATAPPPQVLAVIGPRKGGCKRCLPDRECECQYWNYKVDLGLATGTSSFGGDNEWMRYRFEQELHTARGNEYAFWQQYQADHAYFPNRDWGIGAEQRIPDFWNDGTLRLSESYVDYRDFEFADRRRKQTDLRLGIDPRWDEGRTRAKLDYRFRNVDYPSLPTESYVLHDVRLSGEHQLNHDLRAGLGLRYANYDYGIGSSRSNNLLEKEARLDWQVDCDTTAYVQGSREEKHYDSRKDRNYNQNELGAGFRWNVDCDSTLGGDVSHRSYMRPFNPALTYNEWTAQARYRRQLSCQLDGELRVQVRDKQYEIDPSNDLKLNQGSVQLSYRPDEQWGLQGMWQRSDYDYGNPARANLNNLYSLGANYSFGDQYAGLSWRRNDADFGGAPFISNRRDDYDFEWGQHGCDWRWRSYVGLGSLHQDFPGSVNNFRERRLGCEWNYQFDCQTEVRLRFDHMLRSYFNQADFGDNRLEAGLTYTF